MDEYFVVFVDQRLRIKTVIKKFKDDEELTTWLKKRGAITYECKVLSPDNQVRHIKQERAIQQGFDLFTVN